MARTKKAVDGAFEIYAVDDGSINSIIQVSDPLHMRILNELSESPLSMSEVADITGKAQSTLSVHMEQLVNRNLISYDFDKNDSRRKIFRLISKKIASSKDVIEHPKDDSEDFFDNLMDGKDFFKDALIRFLIKLDFSGLDFSPLTFDMGREFAMHISSRLTSNKVEDVISWIQEFYERNAIGEVCIYTFMPLTIIIRYGETFPLPIDSIASFNHGLFTGLLTGATNIPYVITKSEIFGTGNNYHKFVIEGQ
ncbi:ArsR family transcriptional regulator [Candidatus Methanarcanum hacksteinii]|uniref:ArsR family transcriptional regulator n=1 Tax=Candidatus Methanarcanum hacksteinii TaxID=2911857 RepID=UPI0037DCBBB8